MSKKASKINIPIFAVIFAIALPLLIINFTILFIIDFDLSSKLFLRTQIILTTILIPLFLIIPFLNWYRKKLHHLKDTSHSSILIKYHIVALSLALLGTTTIALDVFLINLFVIENTFSKSLTEAGRLSYYFILVIFAANLMRYLIEISSYKIKMLRIIKKGSSVPVSKSVNANE